MKVGDLVKCDPWVHRGGTKHPANIRERGPQFHIGVITKLWVGGSARVLFFDGEKDINEDYLEVINEAG